MAIEGGRFDFDDGGSYVGEWSEGRAHGLGIATGPDNQGEYSGEWSQGFENRGVYIWPSGNMYAGTWLKGKRHGEGVQVKGRWIYRGQFTTGFCGRYGVKESLTSCARYEGSWHLNQFDGFGVETNSDGSMYAGAWSKGMRQGLGVRVSAPYGVATEQNRTMRAAQSQNSLPSVAGSEVHWRGPGSSGGSGAGVDLVGGERIGRPDEIRSGFVLRSSSSGAPDMGQSHPNFFSSSSGSGFFRNPFDRGNKSVSRNGSLRKIFSRKLRKQKSTGDLISIGAQTTTGAPTGSSGTGLNIVTNTNNRAGGSLRSNFSANSHLSANSYTAARHASAGLPFAHQKSSLATQMALARKNYDEPAGSNVTETYSGQWNEDRRSGYGQADRSDGLRYEGEWFNNKKDGYGCTYFPDGTKEEGRYKENIIIQALNRKSKFSMLRHTRLRDSVEEAVKKAQEAAREAKEKSSETAQQRAQTAKLVAQKADARARIARILSDHARSVSEEYDPDFVQLGLMWEKQNHLITPDLFGGPISEAEFDNPTLFGETPISSSPQLNRQNGQSETSNNDLLNVKSLQVGGSRRGSFRSSFRRNNAGTPSEVGIEDDIYSKSKNLLSPNKFDGFDKSNVAALSTNKSLEPASQDLKISVPNQKQNLILPSTDKIPQPNNSALSVEVTQDGLPLGTNIIQNQSIPISENNAIDLSKYPQLTKTLEQGIREAGAHIRRQQLSIEGHLRKDFDQMSLDPARMHPFGNDSRLMESSKHPITSSRLTMNIGAELTGVESRFEQLQVLNKRLGGTMGSTTTNRNPAGRPMTRAATAGFTSLTDNSNNKLSQFDFQHPHSQYLMMDELDTKQKPTPQLNVNSSIKFTNERRKTLPTIMTEPPVKVLNPGALIRHELEEQDELLDDYQASTGVTYIIEDGIRKRLHIDSSYSKNSIDPLVSQQKLVGSSRFVGSMPEVPPPSYQIHEKLVKTSLNSTGKSVFEEGRDKLPELFTEEVSRGIMRESSMPDIAGTLQTAANRNMSVKLVGITREEVSKMSQARRQELLKESERRIRGEIVIRLADIKDWFRNNFIFVLVFLLNATLAFLFINLLSSTSNSPSVAQLVDSVDRDGDLIKVVKEAGKSLAKTVKKTAKKKAKIT